MKLFWNSRKEEIRMAESQKNQTEKENIVELKTNIYLLSIIGEVDVVYAVLWVYVMLLTVRRVEQPTPKRKNKPND